MLFYSNAILQNSYWIKRGFILSCPLKTFHDNNAILVEDSRNDGVEIPLHSYQLKSKSPFEQMCFQNTSAN